MTIQKKSTFLVLISLAIMGYVYAQRITVPLKIDQYGQLYLSIKYGPKQCEVNVLPSISYCSNIITETTKEADDCGATYISYNTLTGGNDYIAPFQLGDSQVPLYFTVPFENKSPFYGANELCFGFQSQEGQRNALIDLFQDGYLTEERVYFSLYNSINQIGSVGEIDIGAPKQHLIEKGAEIVELKIISGQSSYSAASQGKLQFFGQQLDTRDTVFITLDSPFHQFTVFAFNDILSIFDKQGIQYTYLVDEHQKVLLPSIEKLQPIEISLIQKDNTEFPIIIKPSQYTRQLENGQYQLLIKPLSFAGFISLSYTIFESYYVGFDLPHQTILITKKAEHSVNNFRGSSNISE